MLFRKSYLLKSILINGLHGLFDFFCKLVEPTFQLVRIVIQGVCNGVENIRLVGVIAQRFNEFQSLL